MSVNSRLRSTPTSIEYVKTVVASLFLIVLIASCAGGGGTTTPLTSNACSSVEVDAALPAKEITITLDPGAASLDASSRTILWCSAATGYPELPNLTERGYTFNGWLHDGTRVTSGGELASLNDHTLNADLDPDGVEITYLEGAGDFPDTTEGVKTTRRPFGDTIVGNDFAFPVVTDPGTGNVTKVVTGWRNAAGELLGPFETIDWTVTDTFTAEFGDKQIVLLDPNGGTIEGSNVPYEMSINFPSDGSGGQYTAHPRPARDGYVLDDWLQPRTGNVIGAPNENLEGITAFPEPHVLVAQWLKRTTVTFKLNAPSGVTPGGSDGVEFGTIEVLEGRLYGTLPSASLSGYTFEGWFRNAGADPSSATAVAADDVKATPDDETLYAAWSVSQ